MQVPSRCSTPKRMGMSITTVTAVITRAQARAFSPRFTLLREKLELTPERRIKSPAKTKCRKSNTGLLNSHPGAPQKATRS